MIQEKSKTYVATYPKTFGLKHNYAIRVSKSANDRYRKYGYIYECGGQRLSPTGEDGTVWQIELRASAN